MRKKMKKWRKKVSYYFINCDHNLNLSTLHTGMSLKSAEVIVMVAFQAHKLKDISRGQLYGAIKKLCPPEQVKELRGCDKLNLCMPLAKALVTRKVVKVVSGAKYSNIKRVDVNKVLPF